LIRLIRWFRVKARSLGAKFKNPSSLRLYMWAALLCACLLLTAPAAQALPIVYPIVGGFVDIDVRLGGVVIGSSLGVALTGDSVTVDTTALTFDAIRIEIAATTIILSQPFGGYDEISVESAILEGSLSFATTASSGISGLYTAVAGPLTVVGSWGATDSNGINPDTSGNPIVFDVLSLIAIVNSNPVVEIDQVTINSIDGTPFGEPGQHLTIVASYHVLTPEPGTGLLVALGLVVLAARRGAGSRRGHGDRC